MNLPRSKPIYTVLVITVGFLFLYYFRRWEGWLFLAIAIGTLGSISSFLARKIDFFWRQLAYVLSLFMPKILLTLLFFLLLTPLALLSRLFRKEDPLSLKNNKESLFQTYERDLDQSYFEKTW